MWVEPWGDDVVFHGQGASVWVNTGCEATVYDHSGNEVDCGHQRPTEVLRAWTEASEAAADRSDLTPELRERARSEAETMQWRL
ncbi:hypothetical protein [Streptomyces sp. NPDC055287]